MIQVSTNGGNVAKTVMMVRPFKFRSNEETVENNYYQQKNEAGNQEEVNRNSIKQFDRFRQLLEENGIKVIFAQDDGKNNTPDSIFPNNWVSFDCKGQYILYPMYAPNRRLERSIDIFKPLQQNSVFPHLLYDYSHYQKQNIFLEGTGSMVLDRKERIAFAALSPRTHKSLFLTFCQQNKYKPCFFRAYQTVNGKRQLIYHTNVMMWIGLGMVFICLASIDDQSERKEVISKIKLSKKEIVELSEEQISNFAGNCLMLENNKLERVVVMSKRAFDAYTKEQRQKINGFASIVCSDIDTIEKYGGGSARCMLAQIF